MIINHITHEIRLFPIILNKLHWLNFESRQFGIVAYKDYFRTTCKYSIHRKSSAGGGGKQATIGGKTLKHTPPGNRAKSKKKPSKALVTQEFDCRETRDSVVFTDEKMVDVKPGRPPSGLWPRSRTSAWKVSVKPGRPPSGLWPRSRTSAWKVSVKPGRPPSRLWPRSRTSAWKVSIKPGRPPSGLWPRSRTSAWKVSVKLGGPLSELWLRSRTSARTLSVKPKFPA